MFLIFDLAFIWILFGIFTRICFVEIARNKIYPFTYVFLCVRDILLDRDRVSEDETDRYEVLKCVFRGDFNGTPPQCRISMLTHTHTHTHTLTHMTGQQWLTGQVVPDFSGFANIFDPKRGSQEFFDRQGGHATSENISRVL